MTSAEVIREMMKKREKDSEEALERLRQHVKAGKEPTAEFLAEANKLLDNPLWGEDEARAANVDIGRATRMMDDQKSTLEQVAIAVVSSQPSHRPAWLIARSEMEALIFDVVDVVDALVERIVQTREGN